MRKWSQRVSTKNGIDSYSGTGINAKNEYDGPGVFTINGPYPNPFNPSTDIQCYLPRRCKISVRIYDTAGRLIRNLADETFSSGWHNIVWDGRNDQRNMATSGIYFCRIAVDGEKEVTRKLVLMR